LATIIEDVSRTFSEYLLLPSLTTPECAVSRVILDTPLTKYTVGEAARITLKTPYTSAAMQAVSDSGMAIALARAGGLSFIYCSQSIDEQVGMISGVKKHKAGFVCSDANMRPCEPLSVAFAIRGKTGHSAIAITDDGTDRGLLLGLLTSRDYSIEDERSGVPVSERMLPVDRLKTAQEGVSLEEANATIRAHRLDVLPIIDRKGHLCSLVFRKDYEDHKRNPLESTDGGKRLLVGAAVNTRDYADRIPALVDAGADALCIDSSDGYSSWQAEVLRFVRSKYGDSVVIGAGNVVDAEGFRYLADAGADFVKVGIGGGSICITREQKGIGRGQASAVIDVAQARDAYFAQTGTYVPICSDGGIVHDQHAIIALALGADLLMLGRYFAGFDESPAPLIRRGARHYKEYWGEGSWRARNWARYDHAAPQAGARPYFEEGVDAYIPYAGKLRGHMETSLEKIRSAMSSCGASTLQEFRSHARLTVVSSLSLREGGAHDVSLREDAGESRHDE
jgi:IMP dehydrogenase